MHFFLSFLSTVNSIWGCFVVGHSITKNEARSSGLYEAKSGKTSADIVNPMGVSQSLLRIWHFWCIVLIFKAIYLSQYLIQSLVRKKELFLGIFFINLPVSSW